MDIFYWIAAIAFIGMGIFRLVHPEGFNDEHSYRPFNIDFKPFKDEVQFERFGGIIHIVLGAILIVATFLN